jgi:ribosomal protein S12 methylthiotransferase accessory factor
MSERLDVCFPGGKRVDVRIRDFEVSTDQSVKAGGEGSAPEPFDLFLASIAACAGIYALRFCQSRNLSTAGLSLSMLWDRDAKNPMRTSARLLLSLPEAFPERYHSGIVRAMDLCAVKKHIQEPPVFSTEIVRADASSAGSGHAGR